MKSQITKYPRTRAAMTSDGVETEMCITLEPSVARTDSGEYVAIPVGTCISRPCCQGYHNEWGYGYVGGVTLAGESRHLNFRD